MTFLWAFWGLALGASLGSFLAATAWRCKEGIPLSGRSFCPACQKPIPGHWNIPLIAWIAFRGRARCCGSSLDKRDLFWEIAAGLFGAIVGALLGPWGLLGLILIALLAAGWMKVTS